MVKYKGGLTSATIDKLLLDLNTIWRDRERKQMARLKSKYNFEIMKLRRSAASSKPYNVVDANRQIARLKTDLKCAYKEVKNNINAREKNAVIPAATGMVDRAIKRTTEIQLQRKIFSDENERLKRRINELEGVVNTEDFEKAKYMEGAAWMARLIAEETNKYAGAIEGLCNDYRMRKREKETKGEVDVHFLASTYSWLIESIESSSAELKLKLHGVKTSAAYQSEALKGKVKKATGKTGRGNYYTF